MSPLASTEMSNAVPSTPPNCRAAELMPMPVARRLAGTAARADPTRFGYVGDASRRHYECRRHDVVDVHHPGEIRESAEWNVSAMPGNAKLTMVASRNAMNAPRQHTVSAAARRFLRVLVEVTS